MNTETKTTLDPIQVIERRAQIAKEKKELREQTEKALRLLTDEDARLERLERIFMDDKANISLIQIAESVLRIRGNISEVVDGRKLNEAAAVDIATGCKHLKQEYFGNKWYEAYHQACDCRYGYGPTHGGISEMVGLRSPEKELTIEEKEACIYYLKNFDNIKKYKLNTPTP